LARKIMVIDDDQIILDSVKKILTSRDFEVHTSLSPKEGLKQVLKEEFSLVLSDIRMPEIGGMKVLREIKKEKPGLPVIIITGYSSVDTAVQSMKLGAADYVEKPFSPDDLLSRIEKATAKITDTPQEKQGLVHKDEVLSILDRLGTDPIFEEEIFSKKVDALDPYDLTTQEKLALLTGDQKWIESYTGPLSDVQRRWFNQKLSAEIW
jgi:DNA-binding NtrC family response regulator